MGIFFFSIFAVECGRILIATEKERMCLSVRYEETTICYLFRPVLR